MQLRGSEFMGLFWRHLHCGGVVASVDVIVAHWTADQHLHAFGEVVIFGCKQEIVYEGCHHASAHGPHPVHLRGTALISLQALRVIAWELCMMTDEGKK